MKWKNCITRNKVTAQREIRKRISEADETGISDVMKLDSEKQITLYLEVPVNENIAGEQSKTLDLSVKSLSDIYRNTLETLAKKI